MITKSMYEILRIIPDEGLDWETIVNRASALVLDHLPNKHLTPTQAYALFRHLNAIGLINGTGDDYFSVSGDGIREMEAYTDYEAERAWQRKKDEELVRASVSSAKSASRSNVIAWVSLAVSVFAILVSIFFNVFR